MHIVTRYIEFTPLSPPTKTSLLRIVTHVIFDVDELFLQFYTALFVNCTIYHCKLYTINILAEFVFCILHTVCIFRLLRFKEEECEVGLVFCQIFIADRFC